MGHQSCAAIVRLCEDGTVNYLTGATDCGQGSDTVLVQIVAEELGLRVEDVNIKRVDTAVTPCDPGSYGSRVTILAGMAAQRAAQDIKTQLAQFAANEWKVRPDEIIFQGRKVFVKDRPELSMSFEKLSKIACYSGSGAVILGRGYSQYGLERYDWDKGLGNPGTSYSFTAQLAEVTVDLETGVSHCENTILAHDCGRPLNPLNVHAQNQGGTVQGLGQTLYEGFLMDQGKTRNATLTNYKMPLSTDVPNIEIIDIITEDPDGPYGAKEASEGCIVSTPTAIVSALKNATGIWFKTLPVTPEKIYWALQEKKESKAR